MSEAPPVKNAKNKNPKRKTKPSKITPELILKITGAIEAGLGVDNAMLGNGVSKTSLTEWKQKGRNGIKPYSDLVAAIEEAEANRSGRVEKALHKNINKGHPQSIFFYLEKMDPQYRNVTKHEVTGGNGSPLEVQLSSLPTDQLLKLASGDDSEGSDDE